MNEIPKQLIRQRANSMTRRHFFSRSSTGIGAAALASMLSGTAGANELANYFRDNELGPGAALKSLHIPAKAKRVIYLFMSGGPSQMDMWDYKPLLNEKNGEELPASVRQGQRLSTMSGFQSSLPLAGAQFKFAKRGKNGTWVSELLPHTSKIVDDLCLIKTMHTEAINHDPAITFFQTGAQLAGRPSIGSWLAYGLGSVNENLPSFCVLVTKGKGGQPLYSRLWGSGFLKSTHQGVQLRAGKNPVLYLSNPPGVSSKSRRAMLDNLEAMHKLQLEESIDPVVSARIAQYEMAFRMQSSIPDVANISDEPEHVLDLYGPDVKKPGSFAANCLLARRLAERNVRFVQLFHRGWDQHNNLPDGIRAQCKETDQPCAGLIQDLKQRGMLDDTLVIWGGEFGRTAYTQGKLTATNYGRDHHPRCFSMWMAGGGAAPGIVHGETDEYSYNIVKDPVHVHDFHATVLKLLGIDHERLTYKFQGRRYRLTDVHGKIIKPLIS